MPRYNPAVVEPKWQQYWEANRTFATPRLPQGRKFYVLDMFPYPSGDGLHVGHPEGYTATDIVCRYQRMRGVSVMHPMGWDAFGLPAEQHAKRTGTHPRTTTEKNIANFRRQLKMLGFSYDWDRELATTDLGYFRWTQFIFLVLFDTWFDAAAAARPAHRRAAHSRRSGGRRATRPSSAIATSTAWPISSKPRSIGAPPWAPCWPTRRCIGGVSERGGHPVVRIPLRQWMLRITAYADRLEKDLDGARLVREHQAVAAQLDRPQHRGGGRFLHRHVPGRADGRPSQREYQLVAGTRTGRLPGKPDDDVLRIYTTRPDTLFGATYMVIAPEHPLVAAADHARRRRRRSRHIASRRRGRATWTAPTWPRKRPACSPAPTPSTRSTARRFRSGWPTTC